MKKDKPKNAIEKRNCKKIWFHVHQAAIKVLHEKHFAGGFVSLMDDPAMNSLADAVTRKVMECENISICLKRSKQ